MTQEEEDQKYANKIESMIYEKGSVFLSFSLMPSKTNLIDSSQFIHDVIQRL
jgi:hypothetical protein